MKWQPIETAPQRVKVLLYFPEIPDTVRRSGHPEMWKVDYAGSIPRLVAGQVDNLDLFLVQATHWTPVTRPEKS